MSSLPFLHRMFAVNPSPTSATRVHPRPQATGRRRAQAGWGGLLLLLATPGISLGQQSGAGAEEEVFELEAFEVFSRGQVSALDDKRAADFVGSFVGGDGLDALPDDDIGEALNRLSGVNVVEGDKVSIRGLEGKLNRLTIDGEGLSSSNSEFGGVGQDTRNFDVGSLAVDAVTRIEVIKTLTPDRDADAIGGTVNLVTASALELGERVTTFKFEYRHAENGSLDGYGVAGTWGDFLDAAKRWGLYVNLSYREESEIDWEAEHVQQNLPFWVRGADPARPFIPPFEQVSTDVALRRNLTCGRVLMRSVASA